MWVWLRPGTSKKRCVGGRGPRVGLTRGKCITRSLVMGREGARSWGVWRNGALHRGQQSVWGGERAASLGVERGRSTERFAACTGNGFQRTRLVTTDRHAQRGGNLTGGRKTRCRNRRASFVPPAWGQPWPKKPKLATPGILPEPCASPQDRPGTPTPPRALRAGRFFPPAGPVNVVGKRAPSAAPPTRETGPRRPRSESVLEPAAPVARRLVPIRGPTRTEIAAGLFPGQ